ncbi:hypothetical protein VB735_19865 [Halotia wernerae UHCC 0503]|nr:hypothetical protein [Halotia wernerae UHCC 0503]
MSQKSFNHNSLRNDPFIKQFFARIPSQTVATFSDAQLTELKSVFRDRISKRHAVDIRVYIPVFKRRFYVVLVMGKEKRSLNLELSPNLKLSRMFLLKMSGLLLITSFLGAIYIMNTTTVSNFFQNKQINK